MKCLLTYHTTYEVFASSTWIKSQVESLAVKVYSGALKSGRQLDNAYIAAVWSAAGGIGLWWEGCRAWPKSLPPDSTSATTTAATTFRR